MIYIVKKHEPKELKEYRESESSTGVRPTYDSMSSDLHEYVLSKLVEEQGGLCAYCMCRIPETDKKTGSTLKYTIEHIEPQSLTRGTENWKKELEYSNFLAVCSGNENRGALCCDKSRGNKELFLTPLNPECNHLIQYSLSGKIQAAETIPDKEDRKKLDHELNDILNLNNGKDLKAKRKSALDGKLFLNILAELITIAFSGKNQSLPAVGPVIEIFGQDFGLVKREPIGILDAAIKIDGFKAGRLCRLVGESKRFLWKELTFQQLGIPPADHLAHEQEGMENIALSSCICAVQCQHRYKLFLLVRRNQAIRQTFIRRCFQADNSRVLDGAVVGD